MMKKKLSEAIGLVQARVQLQLLSWVLLNILGNGGVEAVVTLVSYLLALIFLLDEGGVMWQLKEKQSSLKLAKVQPERCELYMTVELKPPSGRTFLESIFF
jgi:hypothetical protein